MAKKEFTFRGKTVEEIKNMSLDDILPLIPARSRRTLQRGLTHTQQKLLDKIAKGKNNIKTHARDMVILPQMIGKTIKIYNGKDYVSLIVAPEMIGHILGEFSLTRNRVKHSSPGVGATKSSASASVR